MAIGSDTRLQQVQGQVERVFSALTAIQRVVKVRWEGQGCTISQASASILGEEIIGKTLDELRHFERQDLLDLLGIQLSPTRLKCAMLSLKVLKAGAYGLTGWPGEDADSE